MQLKDILKVFFSVNVAAMILMTMGYLEFGTQQRVLSQQQQIEVVQMNDQPEPNRYKFDDPTSAYYLLEHFDTLDRPASPNSTEMLAYPTFYTKYHFGLTADDDYCVKHRAHFVNEPQEVFEGRKIFSDYSVATLLKSEVIFDLGTDIQMSIGPHMRKAFKKTQMFDIRADVNSFFCGALYWSREIGKQFSCLTQESNHIPGHVLLYRKDYAAETLNEYTKSYESRPQCFSSAKFFPKTYVLYKEDQCRDFFTALNSTEYVEEKKDRKVVYIRKIGVGVHASKGVELVNEVEEQKLRKAYENGAKCGVEKKSYIVQKLIHNPLLLEGSKFDFRVFMLVASTNPIMAFYHDGLLWVSIERYNISSDTKAGFVPNVSFNKSNFNQAKTNGTYNGMTYDELNDFSTQLMPELQEYLITKGIVNSTDWLENYLRPELKKAMIHLLRMTYSPFLKHSSVFELYGLDFIVDANLNVWFIEANIFPYLDDASPKDKAFFVKLIKDMFEVTTGLLRSRTKRIINYINYVTKSGKAIRKANGDFIENLSYEKEEFKEISKNWFEPEFEPSPTNGFKKIADFNQYGVDRYQGLLEEECL